MTKIHSKTIEIVPIDSIIPNPKNANQHSLEQIDRLEKLISFNGFRVPLIISKRSGFLISGHGRLNVAKKLGLKEVPVIFEDFDNEAQEYSFLISDNEIARWAELDKNLVFSEIENFDLDMDFLGIKDFVLPEKIELDFSDKNKEIDTDNFGNDLQHTCPKCGFEFNE